MATRAEMEAYVREGARRRGLDPDFWAKVVQGESGWNPSARARTSKEDSGGLFQLNTRNGLGVEALRRGIDPHDPNQWQQQSDFALDEARKSHRPWTVARQLKGEATPGIPTNSVARGAAPATAAPTQQPTAIPTLPEDPARGILANMPDPWKVMADSRKERQAELDTQQARETVAAAQASMQQQPPPQAPVNPTPPVPAAPPVNYVSLLLPRLRRGLLASDEGGLLGVG
jgi:hypothetical protein